MGLDWLSIESVRAALSVAGSETVMAGLLFIGTAALVALCVPGVIIPMALSSASLLGTWTAVPTVTLGALAGSLILFFAVRHVDRGRARSKLGDRLDAFERRFARYGLWYIVGLRVCGAPHFLVTAGSALLPLRAHAFAAATAAGLLPVVAMAAAAASAI